MIWLLCLVVLLGAADGFSAPHFGGSFTFELPDNERLCFYQAVNQSAEYELDYRVVDGGYLDVDVKVMGPDKRIMYEQIKSKEDNVKLKMTKGVYEFCFSNEFSTITHKLVFLSLFPTSPNTLKEEAGERLKPSVETMMESLMEEIHVHNTEVENMQSDQQSKGTRSYNLALDLNAQVQTWSIGVGVVVVLSSLGQVLFLRKLFDSRVTGPPNMATSSF